MTDISNTNAATVDHEMVLAGLMGAVIVFARDGRCVFLNQAAENMVGESQRKILGQQPEGMFASSRWISDLIARMKPGALLSLRGEGPLVSEGAELHVLAEVSALRDNAGVPDGCVLSLQNLGQRQRIHNEEAVRSRLAELNGLVATVAHELNNPLSGIRGAAQLLGRRLGKERDLSDYTDMIVRQVDRMSELIQVLMKLEAPAPRIRPVNIHRILNEMVVLEGAVAKERGVVIAHAFDPSLPEVLGDADHLQQLFLNLLKNAVAACRGADGRVTITTSMENSYYVERGTTRLRYIAVDIRDNGPGLDPETMRSMFSPFYSRSEGGYGVGLTVARNIVHSHKGHIRAGNVRDGGAYFRVTLPVAEAGAAL